MPRAAKLKVYRTSTGFHDAYVAAPSQKAALEAWGADANLFARGVAEQVTDPALMEAPLGRPGEVIKILRGDLEEQLRALPADRKGPKAKPPKPRPSRAALDQAEASLGDLDQAQARERAALAARQDKARAALEKKRAQAARAFEAAIERWRG
jgi:hypothetical protein